MVVHRKKKAKKLRGSKTHGWGAMKKHRGAGNRGGRGKSGSGKRADSRKPSIWGDKKYFGKHGFKSKGPRIKMRAVNISDLEENLDKLVQKKMAEEKNGVYEINLKKLGFNKLIGDGRVTKKFRIITPYFSQNAAEKLKETGGEIVSKVKE